MRTTIKPALAIVALTAVTFSAGFWAGQRAGVRAGEATGERAVLRHLAPYGTVYGIHQHDGHIDATFVRGETWEMCEWESVEELRAWARKEGAYVAE